MRYYLGLDNGGTSTKAALFDTEGRQIGVEAAATDAITPAPGFVERDDTAVILPHIVHIPFHKAGGRG